MIPISQLKLGALQAQNPFIIKSACMQLAECIYIYISILRCGNVATADLADLLLIHKKQPDSQGSDIILW